MSESNQRTFNRLQQRGALEVHRVRQEVYTGGKYREIECKLADCMLGLGGGRGTYSVGHQMIALGKPVLPLDLDLGSFSEDGEGALLLHKEFQSKPEQFFPATYLSIANQIESLSLQAEGQSPVSVALRATEVLGPGTRLRTNSRRTSGQWSWNTRRRYSQQIVEGYGSAEGH